MRLNGAIMELVMMRENLMMPAVFKTSLDKVIETISECEEPSVEPEWIPCSVKKHPDCQMDCYVTVKDYTDDYGEEYDLIVDEDTYYPESGDWDHYIDSEIIAWMPKNEPKEPYQPKEES